MSAGCLGFWGFAYGPYTGRLPSPDLLGYSKGFIQTPWVWGDSKYWGADDGSLGAMPQRGPGTEPLVMGSEARSWKLFAT